MMQVEQLRMRVAELNAEVAEAERDVREAECALLTTATEFSPALADTYAEMVGREALRVRRLRDTRNGLVKLQQVTQKALVVAEDDAAWA